MTWRAANSLLVLHAQLKAGSHAAPPATGVDEWGLIGDAAHDPTSDHTPHDFPGWGTQIVTAADFPNRPDLGLDAHKVLDDIRRSQDPRVKYGISNAQMFSSYVSSTGVPAWTWRPYSGSSDMHYTHGHLSVVGDARADGTQSWATIGGDLTMTPEQWAVLLRVDERVGTLIAMLDKVPSNGEPNKLAAVLKAVGVQQAPQVDVAALATALAGKLPSVTAQQVLDALTSDAGQAALVRAANTAEDE